VVEWRYRKRALVLYVDQSAAKRQRVLGEEKNEQQKKILAGEAERQKEFAQNTEVGREISLL
jgi:hypothetical protein